jgi:putative endonuclease
MPPGRGRILLSRPRRAVGDGDVTPDRRTRGGAERGAAGRGGRRAPRELGLLGESLAAEHMRRRGFRVLERNLRSRGGEIDMIAFDGTTLAFVEVKTTAAGDRAAPLERLLPAQRARLRRQAVAWLCDRSRRRPYARDLRLDAIGVVLDRDGRLLRLDHVEGGW